MGNFDEHTWGTSASAITFERFNFRDTEVDITDTIRSKDVTTRRDCRPYKVGATLSSFGERGCQNDEQGQQYAGYDAAATHL